MPSRRLHLCEAAAGCTQASPAERIVAARVEDDEIELGARAVHLAEHEIDVDHLEIDVGLAGRIGVHRHKIVAAANLHAVTGVIEQPDIGALQLLAEALDGVIEGVLVEIELCAAADQAEAVAQQCAGDELCIVRRIVEPADIAVGRIANHKRDALFGVGRLNDKTATENSEQGDDRSAWSDH